MMKNILYLVFCCFFWASCAKKTVPTTNDDWKAVKTEPEKKRVTKTPTAKFIVIDDKVAKKDVDGRLYYDLEGKRYWKNYRDGKYYLFNKSMYNDYDFKPRDN